MIGRLLERLTAEEEGRVLCTAMRPGSYRDNGNAGPCLLGTVVGEKRNKDASGVEDTSSVLSRISLVQMVRLRMRMTDNDIEKQYDTLCDRFGEQRVNNAIRNRILTNRVKRELKEVSNEQPALAECS